MIRDIDKVYLYLSNKKIVLPYRIRIYEENNVERIKISKKRISSKTIDGQKYYLTKIENVSLNDRTNKINEILSSQAHDGMTVDEELNFLWETKYFAKSQSDELTDQCSRILDTLADYYLGGFEGDNILDKNKWEKIKKYEVATFNNEYDDDASSDTENRETIDKLSKEKKEKTEKIHAGQKTRWSNSRTKKIDNIYSYDNYYEKEEWICEQKVLVSPRLRVKYDRVIDKDLPYVAKWCSVDTDGNFSFDDCEWNTCAKQYKCNPLADTGFVQDKILCYKQNDAYHFFDMLINEITNIEIKG